MEVRICICGQVVVDGQVDALNIDTTTENICSNADSLVELLELLVPLNPVGRSEIRFSRETLACPRTVPPD